MRNKKHSLKSAICVILTAILAFSAVLCVTAAGTDLAQTGAKGTVYYQNSSNWSTVYCYMWNDSGGTKNAEWPGVEMTVHKDNVWKYTTSTDYANVIFNNGGNGQQTDDLKFPGDGQIYNGTWSAYPDHIPGSTTDDPTEAPKPTIPPAPGEAKYIYCKNEAGWGSVNCYMWTDGSGNNGGWPGKTMKNIGDNVWQYEFDGNWSKVIFNNGSGTQTGDLAFPGDGHMYNNKTGQWEIYDNSPLRISDFDTNLTSPQYKGTDITLTTTATSTGTVSYKFSVKNPSGQTTVLADFSANNTAEWTPATAGTYTLIFDYKDTDGNENQRTMEYKVEDDAAVVEPILKGVSPKPGQIKTGTVQTITVNAAGGNTGTNLLFYKYKITDPSGNTVNVPYYSKTTKTVSFTPTVQGIYKVTVYVQASDNQTEERTYSYTSTSNVTPTTPIPTNPVDEYIKGDADGDTKISVMDSTQIQRHCAKMLVITGQLFENADVDGDGQLTVMDATSIQRYIAKLGW